MNITETSRRAVLMALMISCAGAAFGGTVRQWAGPAQGGVWHAAGNWSPVGIPEADDAVTLTGAVTVSLAAPTAALATFAVESGATLLFSNSTDTATWLYATSVTVRVGGNLSHAMWPTTNGIPGMRGQHAVRVAAETFTVELGASVNVTARGYPGRPGRTPKGWGPGAGRDSYAIEGGTTGHSGGGGGHGGLGGEAYSFGAGSPYDDPIHPRLAGSGSCGGSTAAAHGGHGGGVIHIVATNVVVAGSVKANGGDYIVAGQHPGAGAGGTIAFYCTTLKGSGSLQAYGGNRSGEGGCGGGGCIAVHCDPVLQAALAVPAAISYSVSVGQGSQRAHGAHGTLYLTCQDLIGADVMQRIECRFNVGQSGDATQTVEPVKIYSAGPFVLSALTLQANQRLGFMDIPGGVRITGNLTLNQRSTFLSYAARAPLTVDGDLIVNGNASVFEYGILRLVAPEARAVPSLTPTNLYVKGDIVVNNGGRIRSHPLNAVTAGVVRVVCDGQITVAAAGLITAMGAGYSGSQINGTARGPSPGFRDGISGSGGGHAGAGGKNYSGVLGGTALYGSAEFPLTAGSGAGCNGSRIDYNTYMVTNASGGGALWLQADAVLNAGTISADAVNRSTIQRSGGGAGGSLLVQADRFLRASGSFTATGAPAGQHSGGGGGGRVALRDWTSFNFEGSTSVAGGGAGTTPGLASAGTVGSLAITAAELPAPRDLAVLGVPLKAGEWAPYAYGTHRLPPGVYTNFVGQYVESANGARKRLLAWTLTGDDDALVASGSTTNVVIDLTLTNLTQTAFWTNQWQLTATATAGGVITDNPSGWFDNGAEAVLSPEAYSGFVFLMWTGAGVPAGLATTEPLTVAMNQARAIQAVFVSTTPTSRRWVGGTGNWTDSAKWSPAGAPGPNDTLTITNGVATLSDPMQAAALTLGTGGTLTMSGWETLLTLTGGLIVDAGSVLTHAPCGKTADPLHRVHIEAATIEVRAGGTVNVNGRGYLGGTCVVSGTGVAGYGPGGGMVNISGYGGSHGGVGGENNHGGTAPLPYDDLVSPLLPGSGGGSGTTLAAVGGTGGGTIRLAASDALTINGTVSADGAAPTGGGHPGGGAGGTVDLTCETLLGGGSLSAGGGPRGGEGGAGAGGRIAVHYDPAAQAALASQPALTFRIVVYDNVSTRYATLEQGGTLWLPDNLLFKGVLAERFAGIVQYHTPLDLSVAQLVANGVRLKLCTTNAAITVAGAVEVRKIGEIAFAQSGRLTVGGNVTVSDDRSVLSFGTFDAANGGRLTVAGNLNVMTNAKVSFRYPAGETEALQVGGTFGYSGVGGVIELIAAAVNDPTNQPGGLLDWSTRNWTIPSGGTLRVACDGPSGGSVWLKFRDLTVAAGGVLNADGAGYWGGWSGHRGGYGPGAGSPGDNSGGGGGYGGAGGAGLHANSYGGKAYGDEQRPVLPGSGGAVSLAGGTVVPTFLTGGGGLIRIESRSLTVAGTITANGANTTGNHPGGAAGGGIYVRTDVLDGSPGGQLRANGRDAPSWEAGSGGGGRIAVWCRRNDWAEAKSCAEVKGGLAGASSYPGVAGTVYWGVIPASGTVILLR